MAKFAVQGMAAQQICNATGQDYGTISGASKMGVALSSGVIAGVAAAIISHPADTLLSKINKAGAGGSGGTVSRLTNIAKEIGFAKLCTTGLGFTGLCTTCLGFTGLCTTGLGNTGLCSTGLGNTGLAGATTRREAAAREKNCSRACGGRREEEAVPDRDHRPRGAGVLIVQSRPRY